MEENKKLIFLKLNPINFSVFNNASFFISEKTREILKNPTQMYLKETLPKLKLREGTKLRIKSYLANIQDSPNDSLNVDDYDRAKILEKILTSIKMEKSFPNLSPRESRAMLSYNEIYKSSLKKPFLQYIKNNCPPRTRLIKTLILTYFNLYNLLKDDIDFNNYFSFALKTYIKQTNRINPSIEIYTKDCNILEDNFCHDLAKKCLSVKIETNQDLNEIISERYKFILPNMDIYDEIFKEIGKECLKNIRKDFYFDLLVNSVLKSQLKKSKMDEVVSELLPKFASNNLTLTQQDKLRTILLNSPRYGDPRIHKLNWECKGITKEARHIFISWLAKEDLEFFFNIVFYDKLDEQKRKPFWLQYVNSRELLYSKVIWSNEDMSHPEIIEAKKNGRQFATFNSSMDGTSCFILVFNNATIVEFSKSGNALYIYHPDKSGIRSDKMRYSISELKYEKATVYKNKDYYNSNYPNLEELGCIKIIHHEKGWAEKTKDYLRKKLAINTGE